MTVLVAHASAHGSTEGVAERIAGRLRRAGVDAVARPAGAVDDLSPYGAVIVGSAIHGGRWLPAATAMVERHHDALAVRPVWAFSVSSVGETSSFFGPRLARLVRRRTARPPGAPVPGSTLPARGHRAFAGSIERGQWGPVGDVVLRACGGTFGDHRDVADIDAWADAIAAAVAGMPSQGEVPTP